MPHIDVGKPETPLPAHRFVHGLFHRPPRRGKLRRRTGRRRRAHHCNFAFVKGAPHELVAVASQQTLDTRDANQIATNSNNATMQIDIVC